MFGLPPRLRFLGLGSCDGRSRSKINFDGEALGSGRMCSLTLTGLSWQLRSNRNPSPGERGKPLLLHGVFQSCCQRATPAHTDTPAPGLLTRFNGSAGGLAHPSACRTSREFINHHLDDPLEQATKNVSLAETLVPGARECRMIQDSILDTELSEPATGEVLYLLRCRWRNPSRSGRPRRPIRTLGFLLLRGAERKLDRP